MTTDNNTTNDRSYEETNTAAYWVEEGFVYGRDEAPEGMHWVRNCMSRCWVLEDINTPYYCSVRSETYFSM